MKTETDADGNPKLDKNGLPKKLNVSSTVVVTCPVGNDVTGVIDFVVVGEKGAGKTQFIAAAMNRLGLVPVHVNPEEDRPGDEMDEVEYKFNEEIGKQKEKVTNLAPDPTGLVKHYVTRGQRKFIFKSPWSRLRMLLTDRSTRLTFIISSLLMAAAFGIGLWMVAERDLVVSGELAYPVGFSLMALSVPFWLLIVTVLMKRLFNEAVEVVFWDIPGGDIVENDGIADQLGNLFDRLDEHRRKACVNHAMAFVIVVNPLQYAAIEIEDRQVEYRSHERLCTYVDNLIPRFEKGNIGNALVVFNRFSLLRYVKALVGSGKVAVGPDEVPIEILNIPTKGGEYNETSRDVRYLVSPSRIMKCFKEPGEFDHLSKQCLFYEAGETGRSTSSGLDQTMPKNLKDPDYPVRAEHARTCPHGYSRFLYKYHERQNGFSVENWEVLQKWLLSAFNRMTFHPVAAEVSEGEKDFFRENDFVPTEPMGGNPEPSVSYAMQDDPPDLPVDPPNADSGGSFFDK